MNDSQNFPESPTKQRKKKYLKINDEKHKYKF